MKKTLIILSIIILIIVCLMLFINKKELQKHETNENFNEPIQPLKLDDHLSKHKGEYDDINISYIKNENIYGYLYSFANTILPKVKYLFMYNPYNDTYKEIDLKEYYSVMEYVVYDNSIYFVNLKNYNEGFIWELVVIEQNSNPKVIKNGYLKYDTNSPRLFIDGDDLYLFTITNEDELEKAELYKLESNNNFISLMSYEGNHKTEKGNFIANMLYVNLIEGNLYYNLINDYKTNAIYSYNIDKNKENMIYKKNIDEEYFSSYYFSKYGCFINGEANNGVLRTYIEFPNNEVYDLGKGSQLFFGKSINDSTLLFHSSSYSLWCKFDLNTKKLQSLNVGNEDYIGVYYVLKENTIIVINRDFKYFIINI